MQSASTKQLPINRNPGHIYALSIIIALLMSVASMGGLSSPTTIYPTTELLQTFVPNDVVNLFIGLPTLIGSIWMTRRGKLIGLLLWPGALLYVLYNYIAYLIGIPFSSISFVYLILVLASAYILFMLHKCINTKIVQARLSGAISERFAGWIMIFFGVAFILRAVIIILPAITGQDRLPSTELGVLIADVVLSVLWIVGGVALLRRLPFGYVSGLGLLFAASVLFLGLIIFLIIQPLLTDAPFLLADVLVVFAMGMICFIPFGLFMRGVVSR